MFRSKFKSFFLLFFSSFIILSCGGGSGSAPFLLTLPTNTNLFLDEDNNFDINIRATTNYLSEIEYTILSNTTNGASTLNLNGSYSYLPDLNYFGSDKITIQVKAFRLDSSNVRTTEILTKNLVLNLTVNPVNDPPVLEITSDTTSYTSNFLVFNESITVDVQVSDVDNDIDSLNFFAQLGGQVIGGSLDTISGQQQVTINLNELASAGLFSMAICASDGNLDGCDGDLESYFIANKQIKTIDYNCDNEGNNCSQSDQYLYYLIGSENSNAKTDYIFIADQINGSQGTGSSEDFRQRLVQSVNRLKDSDAGPLFKDYFNVLVVEEVSSSGLSLFDIQKDCYFDPNIYCIGNVDRNLISSIYSNWDVASFLTSLSGRGVAQGSVNIQPLSYRTAEVVQHELGHSHAFLGDEYDSGGERTFDLYYADFSVNTTTVSDASLVKWAHLIDDINFVPGQTEGIKEYCYNYSDGRVFRREYDDLPYEDCDCYINQFDSDEYPGTNSDPSCPTATGLFEATYYGEKDTYRSRWLNVMWCCDDEYGDVNVEGFAIGSILNQGFDEYTISSNNISDIDLQDAYSLNNTITFNIDAVFDTSKIELKWFVDGEERQDLSNQTVVTFNRPSDNSIKSYSWSAVDLTGKLTAENDPLNPLDFYEGLFEQFWYFDEDDNTNPNASLNPYVSSWRWYASDGYYRDDEVSQRPSDDFMYAELCCSLGAAFKINWSEYIQQTTNSTYKNNKETIKVIRNNSFEKIINFDLSNESLKVNSIKSNTVLNNQIKSTRISKKDIYSLTFYNTEMNPVFQLGIGNPFEIRVQHIGYEDAGNFVFDIPISNYSVAIPSNIDAAFVSINKRIEGNRFDIVSLKELK